MKYDIRFGEHGWKSSINDDYKEEFFDKIKPVLEGNFNNAMEVCCNVFTPYVKDNVRPWNTDYTKLKERFENAWPIDWYWRIIINDLLPKLKKNDVIKVDIHNVRDWILLYVYKNNAGNKKELLRPVLFGKSDRIASFDQYFIYKDKEKEISDQYSRQSTHDKLSLAYVVGRHKVSYTVTIDEIRNGGDFSASLKSKIKLNPTQKIEKFGDEEFKIDYPFDNIILPSFLASKDQNNLLLASDNFCTALQYTSMAWSDALKSLHINAPDGSGKRVLSKLFKKFSDNKKGKYASALIPKEYDNECLKPLFGGREDNGAISEKNKDDCLVLYGVSDTSSVIRNHLLRFLEEKTYVQPGVGELITLKNHPTLIFLTNGTSEEVSIKEPTELWACIDITILLKSPFNIDKEEVRFRIYGQYIHLYWNECALNLVKEKIISTATQRPNNALNEYIAGVIKFFISKKIAEIVSNKTSSVLLKSDIEINGHVLQSIVKKVIFYTYQVFIYQVNYFIHDFYEREKKYFEKAQELVDKIIHRKSAENLSDEERETLELAFEFIIQRILTRRLY